MNAQTREQLNSIGLLILRLGVGGFILTHGWGKLQMVIDGNFDQFADPIGLGNTVSLLLATGAEFFCALLVMIGLVTRIAAVPLVITMFVAAFIVHGGDPWTMGAAAELYQTGKADSWSSKEPALLFLFPFLALIFTGPGRLSIDALLNQRRHQSRRGGSKRK